jgi:hypothetical protein
MALRLKTAIQKYEKLQQLKETIKMLEKSDKELNIILKALKHSADRKVEIRRK